MRRWVLVLAGVGYFLLLLYEATGDSRWADLAREVAEILSSEAKPDRGGFNWARKWELGKNGAFVRCQWCVGAPGVGFFFAKAHEILGEPSYLKMAEAAGETTFQYGDVRHNASQCHGLAGNAQLFIELHRLTGNALWLERTLEFATRAFAYRQTTPFGDLWQANGPNLYSPEFMCGAAGTGHFFLRLLDAWRLTMPFT